MIKLQIKKPEFLTKKEIQYLESLKNSKSKEELIYKLNQSNFAIIPQTKMINNNWEYLEYPDNIKLFFDVFGKLILLVDKHFPFGKAEYVTIAEYYCNIKDY
jgi:hypothetical protein